MIDGKLAIRVGTGFMTIKEFLNIFVPNRKEALLGQNQNSGVKEINSTSRKENKRSAKIPVNDVKRKILWTDRHSLYE